MFPGLGHNQWLLITFCIYLLVLLLFAKIYHLIYLKYPSSFSFNTDVLKSQSHSFRGVTGREVTKISNEINVLNYFLNYVAPDREWVPFERDLIREGIAVTPDYRYRIQIEPGRSTPSGPATPPKLILVVEGPDGGVIATFRRLTKSSEVPTSFDEFRPIVASFLKELENSLHEHNRRLATLAGETPEVWSFVDFLYFSTITQTTVGYGDILPNSTLVRKVVIGQVLAGLLLIGVAINFIVS